MRIERELPISAIEMDHWPIGPQTFDLAKKLGFYTPPAIKVQDMGNGRFKIRDGRHRVAAFKLVGLKTIKAKYGQRPGKKERQPKVRERALPPSATYRPTHQGYPGQTEKAPEAP